MRTSHSARRFNCRNTQLGVNVQFGESTFLGKLDPDAAILKC